MEHPTSDSEPEHLNKDSNGVEVHTGAVAGWGSAELAKKEATELRGLSRIELSLTLSLVEEGDFLSIRSDAIISLLLARWKNFSTWCRNRPDRVHSLSLA